MRKDIFTDTDPTALLVDYLRARLWHNEQELIRLGQLLLIDRTGTIRVRIDNLLADDKLICRLIKGIPNAMKYINDHRKYLRDNGVIQ